MTQSNQEIEFTAARWAVRLSERGLSTDEQTEFDRWLASDIRHRGALLRARAAWADLDRLAALRGSHAEPLSSRAEGGAGTLAPLMSEHAEDPLETTARANRDLSTPHSRTRRRFVIAASTTILTAGAAGTWWIERHDRTYESKVGEIRRVSLEDGSHMVLNTASEAIVHFDKSRREIELAVGEGLFQVAKDPARPFVVRAGSVSVRAVGTVFSVRSTDQQVDVTVTEGVVELEDDSASGGRVIRRVAANEHATVMETREVQVQSIPHDEAERRLAWREGMVDFAGEPLIKAVDEINRHNQQHIVVDDPALASRPVVGLFRANDPNGFAATVAAALGAQSVELDDAIHLRLSLTR